MSRQFWFRAAAVTTLGLSSQSLWSSAIAYTFSQREIDPSRVIAIAAPLADGNAHQLVVVEQLSNRACWRESGFQPTRVEPLLLNFDFTNLCGRSTDSNGYSLRVGGEDLGWRYSLRLVPTRNDLRLMAVPTSGRNFPTLEVGRTGGRINDFTRIELNPGWRITKRSYNGQVLDHYYLTNDRTLASLASDSPVVNNPPRDSWNDWQTVRYLPVGSELPVRYTTNRKILLAPNETQPIPATVSITRNVYTLDGNFFIPSGSQIVGEVRSSNGEARFYGKELVLTNGQRFPIDAVSEPVTHTETITHSIRGSSVLQGAAIGAAAGALLGGITGDRRITLGEILGGAGLGTIVGLALGQRRADLIVINPGTRLTLTLNRELNFDSVGAFTDSNYNFF